MDAWNVCMQQDEQYPVFLVAWCSTLVLIKGSKQTTVISVNTPDTPSVLGTSCIQRRPSTCNRGSGIDMKRSTHASKIGIFSSRYSMVISQSIECWCMLLQQSPKSILTTVKNYSNVNIRNYHIRKKKRTTRKKMAKTLPFGSDGMDVKNNDMMIIKLL